MRQTTEATPGIVRAANSLAQFGLSVRRIRDWEFQNAASYSSLEHHWFYSARSVTHAVEIEHADIQQRQGDGLPLF
ncbi:MAG TPA: hypothetical protein VNN16_07550 [Candidatus Sulfotelmatobacter sp.]|nr:hypothetical protein [Candidatus Sulfotelmatobacter sp.]